MDVDDSSRPEMMDLGSNSSVDSLSSRWSHLQRFLETKGPLAHPQYEESVANFQFMRENLKILVIGAGGLGCELLKDLALMGFKQIDVIDMDTIDLSNLNRQFLFRERDIGKGKADVAAAFINGRVPGCNVKPHYCKIQDYGEDFYRGFNIVVCGLDSIVARRWINGMLLNLLQYDDDGNLDPTTIIPFVDGGTEGFKGNARVIIPGQTACIECNLDLFPPQVNFPMCTIAETPRLPEHCIEYVKLLQWPKEWPFGEDVNIDGDDPAHISWICSKASERADQFGIPGITYRLTQGVVKHIIPAVASTNAVIAGICATEVFKMITFCYMPLDNYMIFNDGQGIYTYSFQAEKKDDCMACSRACVKLTLPHDVTLEGLIEHVKENPNMQMKSPGLTTTVNGKNKTLYISNIPSLEAATRGNLTKKLTDLGISPSQEVIITDVTSPKPVVCTIHYE